MLWTEITKVVTRDGKALAGLGVREWLKERGVLPGSYDAKVISLKTDPNERVFIRSREEITAWLLRKQLCSAVELAPIPGGDPRDRLGARGRGPVNRNDGRIHVDFVNAKSGEVITRAALEQGKTLQVAVRVSPAPKQSQTTLELSFIGAKIRDRAAIRSVIDSTTGYRYLSRVRVARHAGGIKDPVSAMNRTFYTRDYPTRGRNDPHYRMETVTLLGLEAGTEVLQACMLSRDGRLVSSAVLEVTVSLAPNGVGALRIFKNATAADFKAADPEFDTIYALAASRGADVRVGVADTGVYSDAGRQNYLDGQWVAGKYFDAAGIDADRETKPGPGLGRHILDESPSLHGTNVAGQAIWGTPKIKLVDVMVQRGQEMGDTADEATARAFTWARDQGVSVVNCSKVLPFRKVHTRTFVEDGATKSKVLFIATGGNSDVSFPLNTREETMPIQGGVNWSSMPLCMVNTLWVGGCTTNRTPHASRGHGPAIEVMIPSNDPPLYSPMPIRVAYREQSVRAFRTGLLGMLRHEIGLLGNPPAQITQGQTVTEQERAAELHRTGFDGLLGPRRRQEYDKLQAKLLPGPNPAYTKKLAYEAMLAEVEGLSQADLVVWSDNILQLTNDLQSDVLAQRSTFVRIRTIQGDVRAALLLWLRGIVDSDKLTKRRSDLIDARPDNDVTADDGVSFGLPVVANIAAKLKLIHKSLTPNQLKRIIIDTSDIDPGFETQCIARGIVNPLRAYLAAYDYDVSAGGRPHHDYAPVKDDDIDDARRVYYTFFYMDAQGLDLYNAIKDRLHDSYREVNIDLVEAEPPVQIKSEPLTYVTGRLIHGHGWTNIVPPHRVHPLIYAKRHLRLILVNQLAHVEGGLNGEDTEFRVNYDEPRRAWGPARLDGKVIVQSAGFNVIGPRPEDVQFTATARIGDGEHAKFSFAVSPEHIVSKMVVYDADGAEVFSNDAPHPLLAVSRVDAKTIRFHVTDQDLNDQIRTEGRKVGFQFGVVQQIGGNSQKCNIFVNNNYHGGASGTSDAYDSALVLFQHEIGHALGMVPPGGHAHFYNNKNVGDGYGGDGDHCGFNAELKPKAGAWAAYGVLEDSKSASVKVPVMLSDPKKHPKDAPCVMYHTRTRVHHLSKFCDECKGVLSGGSLEPRWGNWSTE